MVEDSVTGLYPTTYLITLNGRKYDKQIQLFLTYFQWLGHGIIIHVISEVWIWRHLITSVSHYGWTGYANIFHIHGDELLCIVKARESEWCWRWTPPVVSSVAINSSLRAAFILLYWWPCRHCGLFQQPHKWWRQMDTDLIKSRLDFKKIEVGNYRWMDAMAAKPTFYSKQGLTDQFYNNSSACIVT